MKRYRRALKQDVAIYATGGSIFDLQESLPEGWNFVNDLVLRGATLIGQKLATELK